jgi:hypothetical protein
VSACLQLNPMSSGATRPSGLQAWLNSPS